MIDITQIIFHLCDFFTLAKIFIPNNLKNSFTIAIGKVMMIILRGGTIEQLTLIPSEFMDALLVTNPGRKSN